MQPKALSKSIWARCAIDVCLTLVALLLADTIRRAIPFGREIGPGTIYLTPAVVTIVALMWMVSFAFFDVYSTRHRRALDEVRVVVSAISVAALLFIGAIYLTRTEDFSRLLVAYFVALDVIFLLGFRWIYRISSVVIHDFPQMTQRTIVVGTGPTAQEVARRIALHPYAGFQMIGYITTERDEDTLIDGKYSTLGHLDQLRQIVTEEQATCVILALPITRVNQTTPAILRLQDLQVRLFVAPDYVGIVSLDTQIDDLFGVPLIQISETSISSSQQVVKRAIDLLLSLTATAVMSPLLGIIALAIRLDSPGPALFVQERVGKDGKPFRMMKFRSMVDGAENMLDHLLADDDVAAPRLKLERDPRITRMGHILRRASLDELPQLFNVIAGDMSLVGPRPEEPRIVQTYNLWQRKRLSVKPGITGPMQVNGRADLPLDDRVRLELDYIQNYSLLADLRLLAKTVPVVISGRGSY